MLRLLSPGFEMLYLVMSDYRRTFMPLDMLPCIRLHYIMLCYRRTLAFFFSSDLLQSVQSVQNCPNEHRLRIIPTTLSLCFEDKYFCNPPIH